MTQLELIEKYSGIKSKIEYSYEISKNKMSKGEITLATGFQTILSNLLEDIKQLNSLPKEETRSVAHNKQTEKSCHVDIKAGIDCSGMCLINHCKWFY